GVLLDAERPRTPYRHEPCGRALGRDIRTVSSAQVAARMFYARWAGSSTSVIDFSHRRPASISAKRGPQAEHARAWAWNRSSLSPPSVPSRASVSSASNSRHGIPSLVSPGITPPAYRYVVGGAQVPHARG